ncbi:MinD/ParA family protein [Ureibacillus thermophilus]|uniref:MinD/ParA family protein n=1 Tax=Ureibacillus thermophilus TaxID=367743 RepID=A0A4P6UU20_9BACL|nr:MinD/ParA family protein [Ureibacillus thermophilus]QBK25651.1 MinD/ParA family protein [Ureibacillus thermophilus]
MRDQAEKLRMKMLECQGALGRSIAVVSGKGGVGKSNFTTNFAIKLAKQGKKVMILDMDIGMANVHILIGNQGKYNLRDYLEGNVSFDEIIYRAPYDIHFISGGSGFSSVVEWSKDMFDAFVYGYEKLQKEYDYILFDMGAGATNWALDVLTSIDEIIVITTAEPTSITDAYSMIKFIYFREPSKTFYILANRVYSNIEGKETLERLRNTVLKFLSKEVFILGWMPEDETVRKAVIKQVPFTISYPDTPISKSLDEIIKRFLLEQRKAEISMPSTAGSFLTRLKRIFLKGRG